MYPAYGRSTSDRQIFETKGSGLPSKCDPVDEVMGDKGFVDDLFIPYLVSRFIPMFLKRKIE